MSMRYLGTSIDIHAGGADLIFPHHDNEIAQSEGATGQPFVRCWLHCSHLVVDGAKMSKSLGNFHTLAELLEAGHDPLAIRYLLASVHYRRKLNFTFAALDRARAAVERLRDLTVRIEQESAGLPEEAADRAAALARSLEAARAGARACLTDDLNTSGALGHLFTLVRDAHTALDAGDADRATALRVLDWIREQDTIWAILPEAMREIEVVLGDRTLRAIGPPLDGRLEERIAERIRARAERDFAAADRIRDELRELGVELEDTPQGVRWKRAAPAG